MARPDGRSSVSGQAKYMPGVHNAHATCTQPFTPPLQLSSDGVVWGVARGLTALFVVQGHRTHLGVAATPARHTSHTKPLEGRALPERGFTPAAGFCGARPPLGAASTPPAVYALMCTGSALCFPLEEISAPKHISCTARPQNSHTTSGTSSSPAPPHTAHSVSSNSDTSTPRLSRRVLVLMCGPLVVAAASAAGSGVLAGTQGGFECGAPPCFAWRGVCFCAVPSSVPGWAAGRGLWELAAGLLAEG